jgi:hypothetical protein
MKNESKDQKSFFQYLISKDFLKQLLFLAAVFLGIILLANLWLRFYTNHGQKITLPNFVGSSMAEAQNLAEHESFELVVMDSVFALGKSGGIIMAQKLNHLSKKVVRSMSPLLNTTKKPSIVVIYLLFMAIHLSKRNPSSSIEISNVSSRIMPMTQAHLIIFSKSITKVN